MSDLERTLREIEEQIDAGAYRSGPWGRFLEEAGNSPRERREALEADVTRVSDKLHALKAHPRFDLSQALAYELLGSFAGLALLGIGVRSESLGAVVVATALLVLSFQPLLKTAAGAALGIRYSYAYLWKFEPRFKMQYGSYLAAHRWRRATVHAAGCFGVPFALWLVAVLCRGRLDGVADACELLLTVALLAQLALFVLCFIGFERLGPLGLLRLTSAGGAAHELRRSRA